MAAGEKELDTSPYVSDEIRQTTCYMCACRCGINVHLRQDEHGNPKVRYIEGNRDHPVNKGVLCAKGSAGIMQHYSPARLNKPLLRTGERGKGEFKEIEWDEALDLATGWLGEVRNTDPKKLAFLPVGTRVSHLRAGGHNNLAPQIMQPMAVFVLSIWPPEASTPSAVHFGNLDLLIGKRPNFF